MGKKFVFYWVLIALAFILFGCSGYPRIYLGNSSGIVTYNRREGKLEVLWENHGTIEDKASLSDSSIVNREASR